jgi:hypothetical protein
MENLLQVVSRQKTKDLTIEQ